MKRYEIIFADLDGTLIDTISGDTFPKGIWDMRLKFDVLDKIKELEPKYILIVSNQGGIEKGFVDATFFKAKMEYIGRAISEYCGCEVYAEYCTTNDKTDPYRKPNTGMLEHLTEKYVGDDFEYIKSKSLMIGDASGKEGQFSDSDKRCAENFGVDYIDVRDFISPQSVTTSIINPSTLTEEQRKAIFQEYEVAKRFPTGENKHVMKTSIAVRQTLEWLFGKDFFKGENNELD